MVSNTYHNEMKQCLKDFVFNRHFQEINDIRLKVMKGFGLTPLFGDRRGYMPPQLKTKQNQNSLEEFRTLCTASTAAFAKIYMAPHK